MVMNQETSKTKFYENGEIRRCDTYKLGSYIVKRLVIFQDSKVVYKDFNIISEEEYAPEIHYENSFLTTADPKFTIQTTAYGGKDVAEIEKIIEGYKEAVEAVKILTMNFC